MTELTIEDYELIEKAKEAIQNNYDGINYNHTVGSAVRCANGKIYVGVNVYSIHGACAEQVALGTAITMKERHFMTIVAVNGENLQVMSPCGNCRQILADYSPDCNVIVSDNDKLIKIKASKLIPYAYHAKY